MTFTHKLIVLLIGSSPITLAWIASRVASLTREGSPRTAARPNTPQGAGGASCKRRSVCGNQAPAPVRSAYSRNCAGGESSRKDHT